MVAALVFALLAASGEGSAWAAPDARLQLNRDPIPGTFGAEDQEHVDTEPSELTLLNFFSEGWDQDWVKRSRHGRTPDMALLRVTTNFLER